MKCRWRHCWLPRWLVWLRCRIAWQCCGPLAVAGCGAGPGTARRGAAYGAGRLLGYAAVGALLGRYGGGLIHRLADNHVNRVAAGLVVAVCLYHAGKRLHEVWQRRRPQGLLKLGSSPSSVSPSWAGRLGTAATRYVAGLLPQTPLGLGMVTAILPVRRVGRGLGAGGGQRPSRQRRAQHAGICIGEQPCTHVGGVRPQCRQAPGLASAVPTCRGWLARGGIAVGWSPVAQSRRRLVSLNELATPLGQAALPSAAAAAECPNEVVFRLPLSGWPLATFRGSYGLDTGGLWIDGREVLSAHSGEELRRGVSCDLRAVGALRLFVVEGQDGPRLQLELDGERAPQQAALRAPTSRSAWIHGWIGLAASAAGFAAGYLYLQKAHMLESAWALKMGYHTAGWHALLTVTLLPASVMGQRAGIRGVQVVSVIFLCIHAGIALANGVWPDAGSSHDRWIAALNALSGVFFLASVVYGQRAYRDMDPSRALP